MATPTKGTRVTPPGHHLDDPFPTTITFANAPNIGLWEKAVKPPGMDGREAINNSTFFNTLWVTKRARNLIESTNATGKCLYRTGSLPTIISILNKETTVTVTYSDGTAIAFYGYLQKFTPSEMADTGEAPEAEYEIVVTNWDPANNVEQGPVYFPASGTGT